MNLRVIQAAWLGAVISLAGSPVAASSPESRPVDCGGRPRLVGISYIPYHNSNPDLLDSGHFWGRRWGTPVLGGYDSTDPRVIRQHAEWLSGMGVDFIRLDWTNNQYNQSNENSAIRHTEAIFAEYAKFDAHPRLVIALGAEDQSIIDSGKLDRMAETVSALLSRHAAGLYLHADGKPLLFVFIPPGAYARFKRDAKTGLPLWRHPKFSLRWMTGFLEADVHRELRDDRGRSKGFWSSIDRTPIPVLGPDGCVEAVTVAAAYPGARGWLDMSRPHPARGRGRGDTFARQWAAAAAAKPGIIYIREWNQFTTPGGRKPPGHGDQFSPELSNDLEPNDRWGFAPMNQVGRLIAAWKGGRYEDVSTGTLLGRVVKDDNGNGRFDKGERLIKGAINNPENGGQTAGRSVCPNQFILRGHAIRYSGPLKGAVAADLCNPEPLYRAFLPPGSYDLSLTLPRGWALVRQSKARVLVQTGKESHVWFFVRQ